MQFWILKRPKSKLQTLSWQVLSDTIGAATWRTKFNWERLGTFTVPSSERWKHSHRSLSDPTLPGPPWTSTRRSHSEHYYYLDQYWYWSVLCLACVGKHAGHMVFFLHWNSVSSSSLMTAMSFSKRDNPTGCPSLSPSSGWCARSLGKQLRTEINIESFTNWSPGEWRSPWRLPWSLICPADWGRVCQSCWFHSSL